MFQKVFAGAALLLVGSLVLGMNASAGQHDGHGAAAKPGVRTAGAPGTLTPMKAHTGPLPALPRVNYEPARPMPVVQQVYDFAARHPEVLQYIPCYCGCERIGHNGNHDCFIKSRAANGRVTEFDAHGIGCTICIDVARDAMTLHNSGQTPVQIRAAIDKKYGSHFPSATPTPRPAK